MPNCPPSTVPLVPRCETEKFEPEPPPATPTIRLGESGNSRPAAPPQERIEREAAPRAGPESRWVPAPDALAQTRPAPNGFEAVPGGPTGPCPLTPCASVDSQN